MPMLVIIFVVALMSAMNVINLPQKEVAATVFVADVRAVNMLAYKAAVLTFLNANPGFSGQVLDASITLPTGMVRDTRWVSVVNSNVLYVFELTPSNSNGLLDQIYNKTSKSILVGTSNGSFLVNAKGYATGIPIPVVTPAIPVGAIVIVGR
jgi:hypothetical protein